jgi:hypothetical protein
VAAPPVDPAAERGDPTILDSNHAPLRGNSLTPADAWPDSQCTGRTLAMVDNPSHLFATGRPLVQHFDRGRLHNSFPGAALVKQRRRFDSSTLHSLVGQNPINRSRYDVDVRFRQNSRRRHRATIPSSTVDGAEPIGG